MLRLLNHFWRVLATGLCFAFFGLGGVFLTLFIFPLQTLCIRDTEKKKQKARKTVHYTFKFFIGLMALTGIFRFDLAQAKKLAKKRGQLVLANHPSLIDVVVLISIIPNADCVVKAHLFKNPFLRGVVKNTGYISNADPEGLLVDCKKSLALGNNVIVFPEGTRTTVGKPLKFQRGAANIVLRCLGEGVSDFPYQSADKSANKANNKVNNNVEKNNVSTVVLRVEPTTLTKSEPWYKVPKHRATFSAAVVPNTLVLPEVNKDNISKKVREFNHVLEQFFIQQLN
jgi:1-acyl-sn-glycerol-3-phosphate acyltransferase